MKSTKEEPDYSGIEDEVISRAIAAFLKRGENMPQPATTLSWVEGDEAILENTVGELGRYKITSTPERPGEFSLSWKDYAVHEQPAAGHPLANTAPSLDEFTQLLAAELSKIRSPNRRNFIEERLIAPAQARLEWEYGSSEPFDAWTFADMGERNVVAQYCHGGFGALGCPWGINFKAAAHFGMDCGWYPTLDALIEDWGISE